jgi:C-terminal processing protease CtpA/Prc
MRREPFGIAAVLAAAVIGALPATAGAAVSGERRTPSSPSAPGLPAAEFEEGPTIPQADLLTDLDAWMSGLRALNPDLSIRADMPSLAREAARIRRQLTKPMSRRGAWLRFAQLNPYLRDAHAGIQMPGYREALEVHLKAGGHIVPIDVRFDARGSLRVFAAAPGVDAIKPGDQVLSVNGHGADEMAAAMLRRSIGDTPGFRRAFAARRFAMFYWYIYGDTGRYDVVVRSERSGARRRVRVAGATTLPVPLQSRPRSEDLFDWRILPGDIGYLRVDSFDPDQKSALAEVAQTAFSAFRQHRVRALIIDVRENGGGDDPLWQQSLMNYITTKPYAHLSRYEVRVTKDNAGPDDVVGDVRRADYTKRFTPDLVNPVRVNEPVYVLAGPYSYSATIQFIVAAQDFGIAKIAGEETAALSCQTGQVKRIALAKTGLSASTPIIAYTRPSGQGCKHGVMPDVPITIDEVRPDRTLDALQTWIGLNLPRR